MAVSLRQREALVALGEGTATMRQVEKRCRLSRSTSSIIVNALMRRGLLTVCDGAIERYRVTEKGRRVIR